MARRSINEVIVSILGKADGIKKEIDSTKRSIIDTLGSLGNVATGIQSAFQLAGGALSTLTNGVIAANDTYSDFIVGVSSFADVAELNFGQAEDYLLNLRGTITETAQELGDSGSYYLELINGVVDDYTTKLKETGNFTTGELTNQLNNFASTIGNYFENSGVSINEANLALNKFISSTSVEGLRTIEFFRSQPALLNRIQKKAEELGKTFEEMSSSERLSLAETVFSINPEAQRRLENSLTTTMNRVREQLLDPFAGFFGYLRNVSVGGEETNVLLEVQNLVSNFLSPTGPLQAIYEGLGLFSEIGDPMEVLAIAIRGINDRFLPIIRNVVDALSSLGTGSFNPTAILSQISESISGFINNIVQVIGSAAENSDNSQLYAVAQSASVTLINALGQFLREINWLALFQAVGQVAIDGIVLAVGAIFGPIREIINSMGIVIAANFRATIVDIQARFQQVIAGIRSAFTGGFQGILNGVGQIKSAFSGISGVIGAIVGGIRSLISSLSGIGNTIRTARAAANAISNIVPNFADGNIPSSTPGIIQSALRESSMMPKGSSLALANTSELILNRPQQMQLASAMTGSSNISINIQGNDPMSIAREVEARLERLFRNRNKFG